MLISNNSLKNGRIYRFSAAHQKIMAAGVTKFQIAMARLLAFFSFIIISFVLVQSASAQTTPRPDFVLPATCGAFEREGFEFTRGLIGNDETADFESGLAGPNPFDPLVIEPLVQRDAATGVVSFFQSSACLLYTSPSPRDATLSRMPSSA